MRPIAIVALCGLLMGCQTIAEQQAANRERADDTKCRNFGAAKGSQAYFQCRMALEHDRTQVEASARMGRDFGSGQGLISRIINPQ